MKIGLNGSVKEASEAVISVYDHGFLYGIGLFETFRTYAGKPYLLDRHLSRLQLGCEQLGIRYDCDLGEITNWVNELLEANGLEDGYIRLTVSAGEAELGLPTGDYEQPNVLMLVKTLPQVNDAVHMRGRELRLVQTRRNTPEGDIRFKSLHYMNNIIAKRELLASGASPGAEGLMLTREGWLAEGIVSNLFFVKDNKVCTPDLSTGILPGITRERVLEIARSSGYETEEGLFSWEQLQSADEIWLTNSIQELIPVTTITDASGQSAIIGDGEAGIMTRHLLSIYRKFTRESAPAAIEGKVQL
ncbi:4-amino-4-deoxychorismate lyase [Paenibacillus sp. FSL H8-0548]|uniref:aminodeoxychorismate lyase n=1 Tax=Paenibacillus sp. FSL H8-0548 TaxID=1920422 RepID=UPI00096CC4DE|nr:aminodeoxychorismate lyase [Paenibacillus sp. FSL H8-0548]OMF25297.1 4-amino-4-deoxychorismate lyase [Paenibacillus sp. FSL H8-0548]